jgi:hypothetical protein
MPSQVKKREVIPEALKATDYDPDDLKITVGDKKYDVPTLTFKQYKATLKTLENQTEDMGEPEALEFTRDFFYKLLKPEHPQIKKEDLDDMPIYQYGAEYIIKLKMALFRIPLGS